MRTLLAIFALFVGISSARADPLTITAAGQNVNMNVKPDSAGSLSSRVLSCDANNPDVCAPVDGALGMSVNVGLIGQGSCSGGQSGMLGFGAATSAAPTYFSGSSYPLSLDTSGNLRVVVSGGSFSIGSNFGATFPASGIAIGAKNGANLVNLTADGSGNLLIGQPTGSNLHMICDSGCSPSNYPADGSAFTAGSTPQLPAGGFFQTTATANPLTNGQMGAAQMTAQRAVFMNMRNASGTELGVAAAPLQVSLANTGANGTAVLTTLAANQSVNLSQVNGVTTSTGAGATSTGSQRVAVGSDTTTIAGSAPGAAGSASSAVLSVQGIASMTPLTVAQPTGTNLHIVCDSGCSSSTAPADESAFSAGVTSQSTVGGFFQTTATSNPLTTGQMGAFQVTAQRALFSNLRNAAGAEVGVAAVPLQVSLANTAANGTAVSVTLPANQSVNVAQFNGVTPLMGAGASGAGSQRVNVAQDTTTIAGAAPGTAGTASANVVTIQGIASMTKLLVTPDANSAVNLAQVGGSAVSVGHGAAAAAIRVELPTDGTGIVGLAAGANAIGSVTQGGIWSVTATQATGANLHVACDSGCSSSSAPADESAFTAGSTSQSPVGGLFQATATNNPLTTGQMGVFQVTANRALFVNLRNALGAEEGIAAAPLQVSLANTGANGTAVAVGQSGAWTVTATQATGSNLHVACDSGCTSSSAPADESTFTAGATPQTPVGGFFQTTATSNPLTTGQMGAFQVTANRALMTNLRNAAGTEIGTAAAPVQVSLANTGLNGTSIAVSLSGNQPINVAQIGGVAPLMGNGVSGTGTQRVNIASDNTAFQVKMLGNAGGIVDAVGQNAVSPANELLVACQFNTTPATITTSRISPVQCDLLGSTIVAGRGVAGTPAGGVVTVQGVASGTNLNVNCAAGCAGSSPGVTSTESAVSVTTGNTFQSAAASNGSRKGCSIQYTGPTIGYVFFGATASATKPASFQLQPGGSASCSVGQSVLTDNIAVTSATMGDTFVVNIQ